MMFNCVNAEILNYTIDRVDILKDFKMYNAVLDIGKICIDNKWMFPNIVFDSYNGSNYSCSNDHTNTIKVIVNEPINPYLMNIIGDKELVPLFILMHEFEHFKQFEEDRLTDFRIDDFLLGRKYTCCYNGTYMVRLEYNSMDHHNFPWEIEANNAATGYISKYINNNCKRGDINGNFHLDI